MTSRIAAGLLTLNLIALVGFGAWCRITSLETAPVPCGDEAFFGIQAEHLTHGKSLRGKTGSGKPVDLLYTIAESPLHLVFPPSYTIERLPAVGFGILAVALTYVLGRRFLDRKTALIAMGLVSSLPIAIIFSRLGWEYSEVPLLTLLIVAFAARAHESRSARFGLMAAYLACIHVSPTVLFLAPLPLGLLLSRLLESTPEKPRPWRPTLATMASLAAVTIAVGISKRDNPITRWTYATYHFGPPDWPRFLLLLMRQHLGFCQGGPSETTPTLEWTFYGILASLLLAGGGKLVADRAWDRLAIVAGALVSAIGFHLVVGPDGFQPGMARYGLFLVVPNVLAVACLASAILPEPSSRGNRIVRALLITSMLAIGWLLVGSFVRNYFANHELQGKAEGESFWTLKTESAEPMARLAAIIRADAEERQAAVVAEDWWSSKPLEFLLSRQPELAVASVERFDRAGKARILADQLEAGGYAVGRAGDVLDQLVKAQFAAVELKSWRVQVGYHPMYVLYRRERPVSGLARGASGLERH